MPSEISVAIKDVRPWTPQTPYLYTAEIQVDAAGQLCDNASFTFGMRTIEVAGGHYQLNGERLWLRGSNLVSEWLWPTATITSTRTSKPTLSMKPAT